MTARRLRAYRPPMLPPTQASRPRPLVTAPGHYDGDGCVFPTPGHLIPEEGPS